MSVCAEVLAAAAAAALWLALLPRRPPGPLSRHPPIPKPPIPTHPACLPCSPYNDFWAVTDYIATVTFTLDIVTKFFLAYKDEKKGMVTDHKAIAAKYLTCVQGVVPAHERLGLHARLMAPGWAGLPLSLCGLLTLGRTQDDVLD